MGEAGCAWPSRDAWEANRARLHGTRENDSEELDPWARSLSEATQATVSNPAQGVKDKDEIKQSRAFFMLTQCPSRTPV